jgi:TonB-dependent receptor
VKNILFPLLVFLSLNHVYAQGSIKGVVKDGNNGEVLIGAKISLEGTEKKCLSDANGEYTLSGLAKGKYTLVVKASSFNVYQLVDILVGETETKTLDISMEPADVVKGPVVVTRKVKKDGNIELLRVQFNNEVVSNGISGEDIRKAPDSKVSDVLKRISGASIQDNKFVVIRGLSDRYNFALLNGAPLPSSESDRKAFSFDIFPSNILNSITILKTASPSLPGEFAGGVININTNDVPEKSLNSVGIGLGFNTLSTFKNFSTSGDGSMDWFGLGAQARAIPTGLPGPAEYSLLSVEERAEWAKKTNYNWSSKNRKALPHSSMQFSKGNMFTLKNKHAWGYLAAYSYQFNQNFALNTRREFEESSTGVVQRMELVDSVYTQNVLNTGMLNFKYSFSPKSIIQFKNLYSINSEDRVNLRKGVREMDNDPRQWEKATNFWYTENKALSSQLLGNHANDLWKIHWNLGYSNVNRVIPALRRVVQRKYSTNEDDSTEQYVAIIQNNGTIPTAAGNMFWSDAQEAIYSAIYDFERSYTLDSLNVNLKFGGMQQYRNRDFVARNLGFSKYSGGNVSFNDSLLLYSPSSIFNPGNLGLMSNGNGGFKLDEATSVDDSYKASSFLNAGFLQLDAKWKNFMRVNCGLRVESYRQSFNYIEFGSNKDTRIVSTVVDFLPSVNVILSLTPRANLRASSYRTVSRPEFRELAPFTFYNFLIDNIISGDPNLKRATIMNYDFRYEYLIGNGQNFNVSGFYKDFTNPIELVNRTGTSGAPELFYTNVPSVRTYGAELEYRFNFGFLSKKEDHPIWDQLSMNLNASVIRSRVTIGDSLYGQDEYLDGRPLQGQSPYIINAGLYYQTQDKKWSFSTAYNRVGQRIYIVGNVQEPSVWENGRNLLDFQIVRNFNDKLELRLNVKDALANELVFFQDLNKNQKFDKGDNMWQNVTFGQTISFMLKYNF